MVTIEGGCQCGRIRYEAEVNPDNVSICHCADCQRLTGSPFRLTVSTAAELVRVVAGEPRTYVKTGDNGRRRLQSFCGECGSPLFATGEDEDAALVGIRWGSIDSRRQFTPRRQIWRQSAVDWLGDVDALPSHDRD